ncbi:hypothetical protein GCM10023169_13830 [Georgenia halophila]|uniref:Fibronectin type-III domain-containing protein n=1 Tax=Georgenia halophila TaxID=620889 RepID=A0ABP8L327_9MICO
MPLRGPRHIIALVVALATALAGLVTAMPAAAANPTRPDAIDRVVFGDAASESAHDFRGEHSHVVKGAEGRSARVSDAYEPQRNYLGDLAFTLKVDPAEQNYLTLKLWGGDATDLRTVLIVDGQQVQYRKAGDHPAIDAGTGAGLPGRFIFTTSMLPLSITQGREQVEVILRPYNNYDPVGGTSRPYYEAFTHVGAAVAAQPEDLTDHEVTTQAAPALSDAQEQAHIDAYAARQVEAFNEMSARIDADPSAVLSVERYQDELRFYSEAISTPWSPAQTTAEKEAALERVFQVVDNHTRNYYGDVQSLGSGGHQSDWGGYYGALGEALYIVENLIADDDVYGRERFEEFLDEPFVTGTEDGENSIAGVDWEGGELTRGEAWERVLKANFDFARSRLSYIYNQVLYTYEGAWEAAEGLRVIDSEFYEGKERSHAILLEALGARPFLGEEVLLGPDGEDIDTYHSLMQHDHNARYTEDYLKIVMRGLATSKTDANGDVVRRRPYGEHYTGVTAAGLTRENGYVGLYGESVNYAAEYFYRTLGHEGDEELNDEILRLALRSIEARGATRYQGTDEEGNRVMMVQQVLDERSFGYPGRPAYAVDTVTGRGLLFASLEQYMANHPQQYAGPEWDHAWEQARMAVGYFQQQLVDNQYFPTFDKYVLAQFKLDHRLPQTWEYVTSGRAGYDRFGQTPAGVVLPNTDLDRYTDKELEQLGVNREERPTTGGFVDVDNLLFSVQDGDTSLHAVLSFRAKGWAGAGFAHVQEDGYDHLTQLESRGVFDYQDVVLRAHSAEDAPIVDRYTTEHDRPFAYAGELKPVTYQPGVGTVERDNFREDHPYSAFPDLITSRYGEYLMAVNTTRPEYDNEAEHTVEVPAGVRSDELVDVITGTSYEVTDGKVVIPPFTGVVLKLGTTEIEPETPAQVDVLVPTAGAGGVGLSWNPAAGAAEYIVERSSGPRGTWREVGTTSTTHFVDREAPEESTLRYRVIAVNYEGSAQPSSSRDVTTRATGSNALQNKAWRDDALGDGAAGTATTGGPVLKLRDVTGEGYAGGEDGVMPLRFFEDSVYAVTRLVAGSAEVSATLDGSTVGTGVTFRDDLDPVARYVHLGIGSDGLLELRTRTLDTRADIRSDGGTSSVGGGRVVSPLVHDIADLPASTYRHVRLTRDASTHVVTAEASADGTSWRRLASLTVPMPAVVHAGAVATSATTLRGLDARELPADVPQLSVAQNGDQASLAWTKPVHAVAFDVYRTEDPADAGTDPREGGWQQILEDRYTLALTDTARAEFTAYAVVARAIDGETTVSRPAAVGGESLDELVSRAKELPAEDFTRGSFFLLQEAIAAAESALETGTGDRAELRLALYAALDGLEERIDLVKIDVLETATITTSHGEHGGGLPKDEVGEIAFDGSIDTSLTLSSADDSWIQVDLESTAAAVSTIKAYPQVARPDTIARLENATVSGSNDGETWTEIGRFTEVDTSRGQWYEIQVPEPESFRYLRYAGAAGTSSSVAEIEYWYTQVDATLLDVLVDRSEALEPGDYTSESWDRVAEAVAAARELSDADQEATDAAATALLEALEGLVEVS